MTRVARTAVGAAVLGAAGAVALLSALGPRPLSQAGAGDWFAPRPADHSPLVFAHQGGAGLFPANTLAAFANADRLGADVLDADLRLTRDGALVLFHDERVDGATDGSGAVRELTLAQVRALDAGFGFSPDGGRTHPYRGRRMRVPLLAELLGSFPHRRVGLEIKDGPAAATELCAQLRAAGAGNRALVSATSQATLDRFREDCPEVATSATEREVRTYYVLSRLGLTRLLRPRYRSLQVPETSDGRLIVSPRFVAAAHRDGLAVQPWTIQTAAGMRRMLALGIDGINTDYPDRLLSLLTAPAAGGPAESGPASQ